MWFKKEIPDDLTNRDKDRFIAYIGYSDSDMSLVGQYENAIDILINQIIEEKFRVDVVAHPLLYLIRHSIELALKENIKYLNKYSQIGIKRDFKTHKLSDLFSVFEKHYDKIATEQNFKTELSLDYKKYTKELQKLIDFLGEDQSSFRYTFTQKDNKIFNHTDKINIIELKNQYDNSIKFLTYTADVISPFTNYADYIETDKSIINDSFGFVLYYFDKHQKDWLIEKLNDMYKVITIKTVWFDEKENYFLYLKIKDEKCYVIPMNK